MRNLKLAGLLLLLLLATFILLYFTESNKGLSNVKITNVTSNSATISWITEDKTKGSIRFSEGNSWPILLNRFMGQKAYDDRNIEYDKDNNIKYSKKIAKDRIYHHVTIGNLDPNTEYSFRISGKFKNFKGNITSFKTLATSDVVSIPDPAYGEIKNYMTEEENPKDGVVYFTIKNKNIEEDISAEYSTTVANNSTWSVDLASVRSKDGKIFKWDKENFVVDAEFRTDIGDGWQKFDLDEYKPLDHAIVNIRYTTEN